jgi:folate-binding protein YgfZ
MSPEAGAEAGAEATVPDAALVTGYQALRRHCGAHPVRRDVMALRGPDAVAFLQGQCSQDVAALEVGELADALLLTPEGKLETLVRAVRAWDDGFLLDMAGGFGEGAAARLARFMLRSKVEITFLPWSCIALRGPETMALLADSGIDVNVGNVPAAAVVRDGNWLLPVAWNGTLGVDILGPDPLPEVPRAARWCGADAWEALRVEAGIPEMGRELDGRTIAAEAGLLERAVSFEKGCYTGQELIARMDARGNRVVRNLRGIVMDESDGGIGGVASLVGATVSVPGSEKPVGRCTSSAWCPGLGRPAALAYLHRSVNVPGPVLVHPADAGPSGGWQAEARVLPLR